MHLISQNITVILAFVRFQMYVVWLLIVSKVCQILIYGQIPTREQCGQSRGIYANVSCLLFDTCFVYVTVLVCQCLCDLFLSQ